MKHDGNDLLRRQDCIETIEGITCSMSLCVNADECHGMQRMRKQAVIELANMPAAQPEIIRCKDCKYMIDTGDDLMCDNAKGWVVATASDFGCVLAERRTDG